MKTLGRKAPQVVDKFNPGQKLNAIFIGAAIVVMLATGAMLKWFRFFPVDWRTGATSSMTYSPSRSSSWSPATCSSRSLTLSRYAP